MTDFVTPEQLASFGAAVAAVVAIVNAGRMLGGEKIEPYQMWMAALASIGVTIAARGAPATVNGGIALVVNAVYVFLAAFGGNETVVRMLERRQAQKERPGEIVAGMSTPTAASRSQARFWRSW